MNYSITNDDRTRRKSRIVMPGTPEYESAMKRLMKENETLPPIPPSGNPEPPTPTDNIKGSQDFWKIPSVSYRGNSVNVDILKTWLDNGTTKIQEDWASYSESARTNGAFYTPDYPLFYSALERAFDLKDESSYKTQVEEMRTVLKNFS